jgi:transcriptional regulator with XRE-family HTH domain
LRTKVTEQTVREGFAERLRQALDDAGHRNRTQRELGVLFGVTPQAVRKWLAGSALPSSARAPHVAEVLGVRKAWLLDAELPVRARLLTMDQGAPYKVEADSLSVSSEEYRLLTHFRALSRQQQKAIASLLASMQRQGRKHNPGDE